MSTFALSAANKAFGTGLLPATIAAGGANFVASKYIDEHAPDEAAQDRQMAMLIGGNLVVGGGLGIYGGITPGNTLREMVPPQTVASNVDDVVREASHMTDGADGAIARAERYVAPSAGRMRLGGAGVGILLGASLGVFALAITHDKAPIEL